MIRYKRALSWLCCVLCLGGILYLECRPVRAQQEESAEISIYMPNRHSRTLESYADMKSIQEVCERTRVSVEWIHPPNGQEEQSFRVMLASGDYPDAMFYDWSNYPGGLSKAVLDNFLIILDDRVEQIPNLMQVFEKNPQIGWQARLDNGSLAWMPAIVDNMHSCAVNGYYIRQDWLDALALEMPHTAEALHDVLLAFVTEDPNGNGKADEVGILDTKEAPFLKNLSAAWGVLGDFMISQTNNEIAYGPVLPAYLEYMNTLKHWYKDGLIDPEFASLDEQMKQVKIESGVAGVFYGNLSDLQKYNGVVDAMGVRAHWVAMPYLFGPAGKNYASDVNRVRMVDGEGVGITTKCRDVDAVLRFLDYGYSNEGYVLYGWGIEGESYTVDDGTLRLADSLYALRSEESLQTMLSRYAFGSDSFAKVKNYEFWLSTALESDAAHQVNETWFAADNSLLLPLLFYTTDESQTLASITSEVEFEQEELFYKVIMGLEEESAYARFVETSKSRGIYKAVNIVQDAYDRYLAKVRFS